MNKAIMPMKLKNLISSLFCWGLVILVFFGAKTFPEKEITEKPKEDIVIEEQEEPKESYRPIKPDYEKLYTLHNDTRKDTCLDLTYEDAQILMKIAVLEDHTDEVSQAYIMSLILNRVNSPDFPNTIREVVEQKLDQKYQFLSLDDKRYINAEPDVNSHIALALVESGQIKTDYLFYEALSVKNSWASRHRGKPDEYGGSRFYK